VTEGVIYSFGYGSDGANPDSSLINIGGTLYGTTYQGGGSGCVGGYGCGTVFAVTTSGTESMLYSFGGGSDGEYPDGALLDVGGTLYGTTVDGGGPGCGGSGCGTVFAVTTSGAEGVLYRLQAAATARPHLAA
jgi:uncharacterized repeat protein (TIGR03803 family)